MEQDDGIVTVANKLRKESGNCVPRGMRGFRKKISKASGITLVSATTKKDEVRGFRFKLSNQELERAVDESEDE